MNHSTHQSFLTQFQPLAAIATTPQAAKILQPLCQSIGATLWLTESLDGIENAQFYSGSLKEHVVEIWQQHKALIFCLATEALVRLIAPLLQNKSSDPAVVVVDGEGRFAIGLCSGHQGGADLLAQLIAQQLDATLILTGASSRLGLPGIDVLGVPYGWRKGEGDWTGVDAAISRRETVQIIQEVGSTLWQEHLPQEHPFYFGFPEHTASNQKESIAPKARVWISHTKRRFSSQSDLPEVQWHPRVLWVGIGCQRGTSCQLIETAIETVLPKYHLAREAIAAIATIEIKADEEGILELCRRWDLPLKTFSAEILSRVAVPNPSKIVSQEVGTPSVAEAAAICASQPFTCSPSFLVPKQICQQKGVPGAVTIAIARSQSEYTGRAGKLYLVGTGSGSLEQITPAAKTAIAQADAVIGYSLYIDLIQPLFRPGQII